MVTRISRGTRASGEIAGEETAEDGSNGSDIAGTVNSSRASFEQVYVHCRYSTPPPADSDR